MPLVLPYARSACVTWMHSSRVGVSTIAWTSSSSGSTDSRSGSPNAAVLPVPVCACPITSRPSSSGGIACSWIGLGVSYPTSLRACRRGSDSPSSAKVVIPSKQASVAANLSGLMSLTVVGSIAFDAVETEAGKRDRLLGGAAVHFALASSFLAETRVVGPVGDDFGPEEYAVLHNRGVITDDVEHVPGGKTFFWAGRYERDVNIRHTLQTDLNVFEQFEPKLSDASRDADVLFLANIQPDLQRAVREQCTNARFVALDTMNLWIDIARESLLKTVATVDCLIVNDGEVRQLTDEPNLVRAARAVMELGPRVVVVKQGEYGSAMYTAEGVFGLPAYPTADVVDPTGAGDSFAGGFMGYVAAHADEEITDGLLRRAMAYGTALASFNVEAFGTERMQTLTPDEVNARVEELARVTLFDASPVPLRA